MYWVPPFSMTPPTAVGVLVDERAVHQVGEGLEAAVRVPVGPARLADPVLDLAHLVHVDERVEVGLVHAGEGPAHREALTLEAAWGGGDGPNRAGAPVRVGRVDPGQGHGVGGHGGHAVLLESLYKIQLYGGRAHSASR